MVESKTEDIEGLSVTTTQLPAMRAYAVFARLGKVLGPALSQLGNVDPKVLTDIGAADIGQLAPAMATLLEGLCEDIPLVVKLLESTTVIVNGHRVELSDEAKINLAFSGKFKALLLTLKFAITTNFADFLSVGDAASPDLQAKASE